MAATSSTKTALSFEDFKESVLEDYKIAVTSRECSLLGRREVLTGKAKFGIFGDGKELPQLCLLYTSPSPRDRQKSRMPSSA